MDAEEQPLDLGEGVAPNEREAAPPAPRPLELSALKAMTIQDLTAAAVDAGLPDAAGSRKNDLIFRMLQAQAQRRPSRATFPVPTTSTSRPRRSGGSTCTPGTR